MMHALRAGIVDEASGLMRMLTAARRVQFGWRVGLALCFLSAMSFVCHASIVNIAREEITVSQLLARGGVFRTENSPEGYLDIRIDLSQLKMCNEMGVVMVIVDPNGERVAGFSLEKFPGSNEYGINIKQEFFPNSSISIECGYEGFSSKIRVVFKEKSN